MPESKEPLSASLEKSATGDSPALVIPTHMRALVLDGAGFEHLQIRRLPTPEPGARQILAHVDAAGICTSLIKLVQQGANHKQLYDWDIARFPLILGDEGSVTLVRVGTELRDRFRPGDRYVIQPAVDHAPVNHRGAIATAAGELPRWRWDTRCRDTWRNTFSLQKRLLKPDVWSLYRTRSFHILMPP